VLTWALVALGAGGAAAQPAEASDDPAPAIAFLTRITFHVTAAHLASDDDRFIWDAEYASALDLVDYTVGRTVFYATYHVVGGNEFQPFDPVQGNYLLGFMTSLRVRGTEIGGVFHHVSRHMSDRPRPFSVAWNMLGVRASRPLSVRRFAFDTSLDVRGATQHSFVDYEWELLARVKGRHPIGGNRSLVSDVDLRYLGVDGSGNRGNQTGARGEVGIRFDGKQAALELFVAAERRIDPYPLEHGTASWYVAGFRFLSR
jgi:hypothetical protein